jgi:hypothetical protein
MKNVLIFLFITVSISSLCQPVCIKGRIVDLNGSGIPYASILNVNSERMYVADNEGFFRAQASKGDSITAASLGYFSLGILIESIDQSVIIVLKDKILILPEIVVEAYKENQEILVKPEGKLIQSHYEVLSNRLMEAVCYSKEELEGKIIKMAKVKMRFKTNIKGESLPVRINFHEQDKNSLPGSKFGVKDILFYVTKMKWYEIPLTYPVTVPQNGLCVSLEFLSPSTNPIVFSEKRKPIGKSYLSRKHQRAIYANQRWVIYGKIANYCPSIILIGN